MCDAFVHALERRVLFAGAELVRDIKLGTGSPSTWQDFVAHGSTLYFSVDDGSIGRELWLSNGTPGSTSPVELNLGTGGSNPTAVAEAGGRLWFTASNTANQATNNRIVYRLEGQTAYPTDAREATGLTGYRQWVYFGGYHKDTINSVGHELYRMNPDGTNVELVKDIRGGGSAFPSYLLRASSNFLYFAATSDSNGAELFVSNGDPEPRGNNANTVLIDVLPGSAGSNPLPGSRVRPLAEAGQYIYASAEREGTGRELLAAHNASLSTFLYDLNPGPGHSSPDHFTPVGPRMFFTATLNGSTRNLFEAESDSQIRQLTTLNVGGAPAVVGKTVFFQAGVDLYKTDGTVSGTQVVKAGVAYGPPVAMGGRVYFMGYDSQAGYELWQSDGTPTGTGRVANIYPGGVGSDPSHLTNVNGTLYFTAVHPDYGRELWKYTPDVTPEPPTVSSITLSGGFSPQRSRVIQVNVTFDRPVTLSAGAFGLLRLNSGGSGANDNSAPTDISAVLEAPTKFDDGKTWFLTFAAGSPLVQNRSLADGIYRFTVDPTKVTANGIAMAAAPKPFTFHRLFGDHNGDGTLNPADYLGFRNAFGRSSGDAAYVSAFDFNEDGTINPLDYLQLRNRFGKMFTY